MDKLQEIREALAAATPGPWVDVESVGAIFSQDATRIAEIDENGEPANAHLIANAPSYINYLLETVEQLQQQNTAMKEALNSAKDMIVTMCADVPNEIWTKQDSDAWFKAAEDEAGGITALLSTIEGGKAE